MRLPNRKPQPPPLNIFDFNHIDPTLPKDTVDMLKRLFAFYHKKHWGYEKLFRTFQRRNLLCNVVAGKAVVTGAVAGGVTLQPVVIASLTAFGAGVKIVAAVKKYDKKAKKANFARVEYKKILDAIRVYLRGEPFDAKEFFDKLKMIDDFVSDHCMEIPEKLQAKYAKHFVVEC